MHYHVKCPRSSDSIQDILNNQGQKKYLYVAMASGCMIFRKSSQVESYYILDQHNIYTRELLESAFNQLGSQNWHFIGMGSNNTIIFHLKSSPVLYLAENYNDGQSGLEFEDWLNVRGSLAWSYRGEVLGYSIFKKRETFISYRTHKARASDPDALLDEINNFDSQPWLFKGVAHGKMVFKHSNSTPIIKYRTGNLPSQNPTRDLPGKFDEYGRNNWVYLETASGVHILRDEIPGWF